MKNFYFLKFLFLYGIFFLASEMHAQSSAPQSESAGLIRLLHFSNTNDNVAVFLVRTGKKVPPVSQRLWLARGSVSGDIRSYQSIPSGSYTLFVMKDGSTARKMQPMADDFESSRDALLAQHIEIEQGARKTVYLRTNSNDQFEALLLNDTLQKKGDIRVFNLTTGLRPTLYLRQSSGKETSLPLSDLQHEILHSSDSVARLRVSHFDSKQNRQRSQRFECNFEETSFYSVIITHDRYGRFIVLSIPGI